MSTNKKAVFWNLDRFLRTDILMAHPDITKKGDFLPKHFFSVSPRESLGHNFKK